MLSSAQIGVEGVERLTRLETVIMGQRMCRDFLAGSVGNPPYQRSREIIGIRCLVSADLVEVGIAGK